MQGLYVITERWRDRAHAEVARAALAGGAAVIQLRDKDMPVRELAAAADELRELCTAAGALFIVNDRLDIALASRADGVHLGPEDLPVAAARSALAGCGRRLIIGASASTVDEALQAVAAGADYLGVGPMFATATKPDAGAAVGPQRLAEVRSVVAVPLAGIGGVDAHNAGEVIGAGADAVAVISAVSRADDMQAAARAIADAIERARRQRTTC